jgi:hypothetical protein
MDQTKTTRPATDQTLMEQVGIDRILATEEALIPSSGFLASVMERVQEEAAAPPPIPFPWRRAIPGMVVVTGVLGWGAFEFVRQAIPVLREHALAAPLLPAAVQRPLEQAAWVVVALAASLLSWLLPTRLAGSSNLL